MKTDLIFPFVILYYVNNIIRTSQLNESNPPVKLSYDVRSVLKISLFGLIALFVLTVSIPSAFAQSPESETSSPIKMVLDLTRGNLLDSFDDTGEIPSSAQTFYDLGQEEYQKAIDALNAGDFDAAEEHALIAMTLFDNSASVIGKIIESESFENSSGIEEFSSQIINQPSPANIFEIQEKITDTDEEVENLRQLIESNNLDVNLDEYEKSINLAKEGLADGDISGANEKLSIANEMKNEVYNQINVAVEGNQDERIEQFVTNSISTINQMLANGEELGLSQETLNELQETLDVLNTGEIDEILEKTDDKSNLVKELREDNKEAEKELREDNKEAEKELREDNKEAEKELRETDSEAAKELKEDNKEAEKLLKDENKEAEKELREDNKEAEKLLKDENKETEKEIKINEKIGKIPPGLAKLFKNNEGESETSDSLPPGSRVAGDNPSENGIANGQGLGLGNIPPGQLKKLDYSEFGTYSPDNYFEEAFDDQTEDTFERSYDKMNKESKQKDKKDKKDKEKKDKEDKGNTGGGNPNCNNEGIVDGESANTSGILGVDYTVQGFTGIGSNCKDITDKIKIEIDAPSSPPSFAKNKINGYTFQPDEVGVWTITASATGQFTTRTINVVTVGNAPNANAGNDQTVTEGDLVILDGTGSTDSDGTIVSYSWVRTNNGGSDPELSDSSAQSPTFTAPNPPGSTNDYEYTLTIEDNDGNFDTDIVVITVNESGGGGGGANNSPVADAGPDQTVTDLVNVILDGTGSTDSDGTITTYSWVKESPMPNLFLPDIPSSSISPTFTPVDVSSDTTYTFTLTVTDNDGAQSSDSVDITVTDGGAGGGGSGPPSQVTNVSAKRDNKDPEIDITWNTPSDIGGSAITGYFIEIESPSGGGFSTEVANTGTITTSYTDSSLSSGTEYCYRISAINSDGTGPVSTSDCATTK